MISIIFYIPSAQLGIRVSHNMADMETRKRETSALARLNAFKPLKRSMIITYNEEGHISVNGQPFEVVPVWKWRPGNELWQARSCFPVLLIALNTTYSFPHSIFRHLLLLPCGDIFITKLHIVHTPDFLRQIHSLSAA